MQVYVVLVAPVVHVGIPAIYYIRAIHQDKEAAEDNCRRWLLNHLGTAKVEQYSVV